VTVCWTDPDSLHVFWPTSLARLNEQLLWQHLCLRWVGNLVGIWLDANSHILVGSPLGGIAEPKDNLVQKKDD
jgi:hypothetical protein